MHLHAFALGAAAGVLFGLWNRGRTEFQRLLIGIAVLALGLGLKMIVTVVGPVFGALTAANGLGAPVFIGVIWLVASLPERIAKPLEWRPLVILGEASYAVYLLQYPAKLGFDRYAAGYLDAFSPTGRLIIFIGALTGVSVSVYACFERPARRWIKRGFQTERAPSASQAI
jgi:peptidoglycan/LPS O-acetylase OafA/YrhL